MIRKISARNINEIYRNSAFRIVNAAPPEDIDEFSRIIVSTILYIRENDYDFYNKMITSIYPIYYIENRYFERSDAKLLKESFANYDLRNEFDTITSFEELDCVIETNPKILIDMLAYNRIFFSRPALERREIFLKTSCYDEYLTNINPLYFLDKFDYTCRISGNDLYELYNVAFCDEVTFSKNFQTMMDSAGKEAKQEVCFYLENLSFYDMEAYSSVLDEILFDSYKFLKFLSESYTLDESKAKLLNFLEQDNITFDDYLNVSIDENLNGKDNFLFDVIDNYILYKSRGVEFEESLNEYYESKKNTIKIKRIGNKGLK